MSPRHSASSEIAPRWGYVRPELGRTGRTITENNFAKERRDWLSILLREILQNALDARLEPATPVTVCLTRRALSGSGRAFIEELLPQEHIDRLKVSVPHLQSQALSAIDSCLVVEDFGTSGLTGALDDPERDGRGENWNGFWFREGEGGKERGAGNGGAGQGKITYFSTSQVRTIFGFTVRANDRGFALFGASSFARDYQFGPHKWKRDAYWGMWQSEGSYPVVLPVQADEAVNRFRTHLGLSRSTEQTGLSLVIPAPKSFDEAEVVAITLAEFFVPIVRGDLVVKIGDVTIDRSTVVALADSRLSDAKARELHTCTTMGFREFAVQAIDRSRNNQVVSAKHVATPTELCEASFSQEDLVAMRAAIQSEQMVSVRVNLTLKPKGAPAIPGHFDVHLHCPFDLDHPEQAVVRRDLLIGEEPIGGGRLKQRARGLTLVSDAELSTLLLSAEEATHLRWNTRLPRLGEYYKSGPDVVGLVRNGMARLLDVLNEGHQGRDFRILAKYFSAPGEATPNPERGKRKPKGKQPVIPREIPPATPKLLALEALQDGCRVRPARSGALDQASLPISVTVEFAYEGLDKDAFSEYDPLDFDLVDNAFTIQSSGCGDIERKFNRLKFSVVDRIFDISVRGFDSRLRLRMRLSYEESVDAAAVDSQ